MTSSKLAWADVPSLLGLRLAWLDRSVPTRCFFRSKIELLFSSFVRHGREGGFGGCAGLGKCGLFPLGEKKKMGRDGRGKCEREGEGRGEMICLGEL